MCRHERAFSPERESGEEKKEDDKRCMTLEHAEGPIRTVGWMDKHVIRSGKPYAKGGPASKRKTKRSPLKQTKLGLAPSSKAEDVFRRPPAGPSSGKHVEQAKLALPADSAKTSGDNGKTPLYKKKRSDDRAGVPGNDVQVKRPKISQEVVEAKARRARLNQSRLSFEPGGDRFMSSDPFDSEDEEFRGTQMAPPKKQLESASSSTVNGEGKMKKATQTMTPRNGKRKRGAGTSILISSSESDSASGNRRHKLASRDTGTLGALHESEGSEEDLVTPLRRRKRFMPTGKRGGSSQEDHARPTKSSQAQEDEEVDEEARDLDSRLIKTSKYREGNRRKSAFRDHLERLRRKKAGLPSESEGEDEEEEDEGEDEGEAGGDIGRGAVAPNQHTTDWIVEEDEEDQALVMDDLPAEFQQPRQPMEQFKIAVQWEVLDLLMPQGGLTPDAYFKPAIDWFRDRTYGRSQAAVSSIWRRPFVRALQRGPDMVALETGDLGEYCDACGRTNRIATWVVKFEGSRYDHLTLEDLASDADSSEDDLNVDEDAASDADEERARKERILRQEWNLGVNCYERATVTHTLYHLRKHLREEVHAKLRSMGLFTAGKKYEAAIMTKKRRIEFANEVTEQLDRQRFQEHLWARYKAEIEKNEKYIVDPNAGRRRTLFH